MEPKFPKPPYTACFQIYGDEVTGFHITASPHGSSRPLAKCDDSLDKDQRVFAPGELKALGNLLATAPELYEALDELVKAFDGETDCTDILDLIDNKNSIVRAALAKARGETLPEAA